MEWVIIKKRPFIYNIPSGRVKEGMSQVECSCGSLKWKVGVMVAGSVIENRSNNLTSQVSFLMITVHT